MKKNALFSTDLHMHTCHSKDSLALPGKVVDAAVRMGLSAIAITDHDEIDGALEAATYAREKELPLQVIIGEEVGCPEGDLLVYFVKKKIAKGPLASVLEEVWRQKAICCMAHPYDRRRMGMMARGLPEKLLAKIDAIEAFNARSNKAHNEEAAALAKKYGKPMLAGSDAHHPSEIGTCRAVFFGVKKLDARNMLSAKRELCGKLSSPLVRFYSRYAVFRKKILRA